jgi:hypothetical protein
VQAIGRGRGILSDGIPVIVLTTEECGLKLADVGYEPRPLLEDDARLLAVFGADHELSATRASAETPQENSYGESADPKLADARFWSTTDLAKALGKPERTVRDMLGRLEARGVIERDGARGGWRIVRQVGPPA